MIQGKEIKIWALEKIPHENIYIKAKHQNQKAIPIAKQENKSLKRGGKKSTPKQKIGYICLILSFIENHTVIKTYKFRKEQTQTMTG